MANTNPLVVAIQEAAIAIEAECQRNGTPYAAEQTNYGVEAEVLIDDTWTRLSWVDFEDGEPEIEAVRLFDCDGHRGNECKTVEEVQAERKNWIENA